MLHQYLTPLPPFRHPSLPLSPQVWDVLSNEEVVRLVAEAQAGSGGFTAALGMKGGAEARGRAAAARAIVSRAVEVWTQSKPGCVRDDISAAVLFLRDQQAPPACSACCAAA